MSPSASFLPPHGSFWEERPTGGALQLPSPWVPDAAAALELVVAHGRSFWFVHVFGVPFEIEAGIA